MKILSIGSEGSRLLLEKTEAIVHCNYGQGVGTCCFLAIGPDGFECLYKNKKNKKHIMKLYKDGKMVARWLGCKWRWINKQLKDKTNS